MDTIRRFYREYITSHGQPPVTTEQAASKQFSATSDLPYIFSLAFLTSSVVTIASIVTADKPKLENHPMCGRTNSGQVSIFLFEMRKQCYEGSVVAFYWAIQVRFLR